MIVIIVLLIFIWMQLQIVFIISDNTIIEDKDDRIEDNVVIKSDHNTLLAAKIAAENERLANLPPIRGSGVIEFSVSERQFPAPKRESNREMEEKWAKQQKEALKKISEGISIYRKCSNLGRGLNFYLGFFERPILVSGLN